MIGEKVLDEEIRSPVSLFLVYLVCAVVILKFLVVDTWTRVHLQVKKSPLDVVIAKNECCRASDFTAVMLLVCIVCSVRVWWMYC